MSKFKVGDIVIGVEESPYAITNKNCILRICQVNGNTFDAMVVKHLNPRWTKINHEYYGELDADYFTHYQENNNFCMLDCNAAFKHISNMVSFNIYNEAETTFRRHNNESK